MKYTFRNFNKKYYIFKNSKKLKTLNNQNYIFLPSKKLAQMFINELKNLNSKKNFSIMSLVFYSCDLKSLNRKKIIEILCENVKFDNILYRPENNEFLKKKMDSRYKKYIENFKIVFNFDLNVFSKITKHQTNLNFNDFKNFLFKIDNFKLTLLFKLVNISKSVILSYNFITNKFGIRKFMNLYNLEYIYQKEKWGQVDEQKPAENNINEELKNIEIFFKNL